MVLHLVLTWHLVLTCLAMLLLRALSIVWLNQARRLLHMLSLAMRYTVLFMQLSHLLPIWYGR